MEESRSGLSLASFAQGFREEDSLSFGFSFPFFSLSCSKVVSPLGPRLGGWPWGQGEGSQLQGKC